MAMNGRALFAISTGVLFVWSGVKGWSILGTVADLVGGKKPNQPVTNNLLNPGYAGDGAASPGGGPIGGNSIVEIAMSGQGHAYVFGGAPGKDGSRPWDCSSFVNYVVGVKLGRAIPGIAAGRYDGSSHGPPTGMWGMWSGLQRLQRSEVAAGDIVVWVGHMGIAIANNQMISAQNPQDKTRVSAIDGFGNGPVLVYGRLK